MLELRAWQLARMKVGKRIHKQVWDDMEVKGMFIKVPTPIMNVLAFIMTVLALVVVDLLAVNIKIYT